MDEFQQLLQDSIPWLAPVLGTTILLLTLPLAERQGRSLLALVFAIAAVSTGILALGAEGDRMLEVVNQFPPNQEPGEGVPALISYVVERQVAPAWAWPATAAGLFALMALGAFLTRNKDGHKGLWLHATLVGLFVVFARLCFEKVAAPAGLVWATGASFSMLVIGVFFGLYSRRRGNGLWAMVGGALLSGLAIRAGICAVSYLATIKGLGSHLDVHSVTEWHSSLGGPQKFETDTEAWLGNIVIPQMALWAPMHAVSALVFGWAVRFLTREQDPSDEDAFEGALPPVE